MTYNLAYRAPAEVHLNFVYLNSPSFCIPHYSKKYIEAAPGVLRGNL